MGRRKEQSSDLKVRVSYEATRLSQTHVAAAFDLLVPVVERRTFAPHVPSDGHHGRVSGNAKPMRGV